MKSERIYSIDTLRFMANFLIILTHTQVIYFAPSFDIHGLILSLSYVIYGIGRLAVPFFFIFSGYFFTKSILKGAQINILYLRAFRKLFIAFICYQILYGLIPLTSVDFHKRAAIYGWLRTLYWYFQNLIHHPFNSIFLGTKYHLWFLPALIVGVSTVALCYYFNKKEYLGFIACVAYLINILCKEILFNATFLSSSPVIILMGLSAGITYVSWGSLIANFSINRNIANIFIVCGVILFLFQYLLLSIYHINPQSTVYIGVLPLLSGVFMLALLNPQWGRNTFFPKLGLVTLWIYGVHPFVIDQLYPLRKYINPFIWNMAFPFLVYLISILIVVGIKNILKLKRPVAQLSYESK
jgi:surface polysaccharide O-acyltransferase-like enzyme